jgi:hypothetical protein
MAKSVESALTTKGQATVPKAIREHLGLRCGDQVRARGLLRGAWDGQILYDGCLP